MTNAITLSLTKPDADVEVTFNMTIDDEGLIESSVEDSRGETVESAKGRVETYEVYELQERILDLLELLFVNATDQE